MRDLRIRARTPLQLSEDDRRYEVERHMARVRVWASVFYWVAALSEPGDNADLTWAIGGFFVVVAIVGRQLVRRQITPSIGQQLAMMAADTAVYLGILANNTSLPGDSVYLAAAIVVLEGAMRWAVRGGLVLGALMAAAIGVWTWDTEPAGAALQEPMVLRGGIILLLGFGVGVIVRNGQDQTVALRLAIDNSTDAVLVLDGNAHVVSANDGTRRVLGRLPEELRGTDFPALFGDAGAWLSSVSSPVARRMPYVRPGGALRYLQIIVTPVPGIEASYATCRDVTDEYEAGQKLRHDAFHDPLTGLANRRLLEQSVEHAVDERAGTISLLFVDLDGFKAVNDTHGHAVGDRLLEEAAHRMAGVVRGDDLLARYAGDEFCVLLDNADHAVIDRVVQRLVHEIRTPFHIDGHEIRISCSVGAVAHLPPETGKNLLRRADREMYEAKSAGGDRAQVRLRPVAG